MPRRPPGHDTPDEYRYRAWLPGPCPEHERCILIPCQAWACSKPAHVTLGPGRPTRFCSPACRVAEHRRLSS
jgi:hypothetical protein